MYRISADQVLNRLIITLGGTLGPNDTDKIEELIYHEVKQLSPEFSVITNLTTFKSLERITNPLMSKIAKFLKSKRCGQIIRVVGASKEGLLTFAQSTSHIKDYNVSYVATMEEALKILKIY